MSSKTVITRPEEC